MTLFAFETYELMAAALRERADLKSGQFRVARFENGELHIDVHTSVQGEDCFILASVAPPDEQVFSALLLSHTALGIKPLLSMTFSIPGGTLVSACEKLRKIGVEEINIMVTHGLFTGDRWKELCRFGVKRIFCTDSVPIPARVDGGTIERLSIVALFEKELCELLGTARKTEYASGLLRRA